VGEPKTGSDDQNDDHQAVFDVVACLQGVVPEVKGLRDLAAKTNQEKQKRTDLKKVSPHFTLVMPSAGSECEKHASPTQYTATPRLKRI
jgi:hypothetical protein